jgi:hypothetical protein
MRGFARWRLQLSAVLERFRPPKRLQRPLISLDFERPVTSKVAGSAISINDLLRASYSDCNFLAARTRATSNRYAPATMRSVSALASHPTIGSIVKPCASRIALGAAVMAGGEQFDASTNRRGRRATYPAVCGKRATLVGNVDRAIRSRSAGGTEQTAGMLSGHLFGPGGNTTPEDIGSMGGEYGPLRRRHSGKGRAVPGRCPSIPVVPSFAALNPFYGADR